MEVPRENIQLVSLLRCQQRSPVILPRPSSITTLYILHFHAEHTGTSQTLIILRQLVWIPQGRAEVRRVIKKFCSFCRREKAAPFHLPPFPDHPQERVKQPAYPFCNNAIDYLGPFNVEKHPSTIKYGSPYSHVSTPEPFTLTSQALSAQYVSYK
ncbi:hypothetical protein ANCCAN_14521 [Ancylostoma caninum]|uniref:Integrase zinc-binding domain-containing protein n=1 Tax=Ancylostoma caninum TaxID=29170 RepID=A0A368G8C8_ANCCA|nr:hypothetical protein ANCCAN_14521 [Ancylostoma caninum]